MRLKFWKRKKETAEIKVIKYKNLEVEVHYNSGFYQNYPDVVKCDMDRSFFVMDLDYPVKKREIVVLSQVKAITIIGNGILIDNWRVGTE